MTGLASGPWPNSCSATWTRSAASTPASATARLADYIPELAGVDPNGFGLSLSSPDGFVYESGDAAIEFTIQSISKPFTYALALDRIGAGCGGREDRRRALRRGVQRDQRRPVHQTPEEPDDQRRRHRGRVADSGVTRRRALRPDPGLLLRVRRPATRTRRRGVRLGEGDRQPQPRHRLHARTVSVSSTTIPTRCSMCTSGSAR